MFPDSPEKRALNQVIHGEGTLPLKLFRYNLYGSPAHISPPLLRFSEESSWENTSNAPFLPQVLFLSKIALAMRFTSVRLTTEVSLRIYSPAEGKLQASVRLG